MQTPLFVDGQFVDGTLLNGAIAMLMNDFESVGSELHTAGLLNPQSIVFTPNNLQVTVDLPSDGASPFAVLFRSGLVVNGNGVVSGATSSTYTLNLASLVPASGSVTVYLIAGYGQIGEQQIQVIGPPEGHPDYDPTFAPFNAYLQGLDTLSLSASTAPADNSTTFELARLTLAAGQSTINPSSIITSNWKYASSVLGPTGVTPGTYEGATINVAADGRIIGVSGVAYGPLAGNNDWTGSNSFSEPVTIVDPTTALGGNGAIVINGTTGGAQIALKGNGNTTPNKYLRVLNGILQVINTAYTAAILTLDDAGNLGTTGNVAANGKVSGTQGIFGTGGISTTGNASAANVSSSNNVSANVDITANRNVSAGGNLYTGSGGQAVAGTGGFYSAGGGVAVGGGMSAGGGISSNGQVAGVTVVATNGNITASQGRLRASFGAAGSGDPNAATLLGDFPFVTNGAQMNGWYFGLPQGQIFQTGTATMSGPSSCVWSFPFAFPHGVLGVWATPVGQLFRSPVTVAAVTTSYSVMDTADAGDAGLMYCLAIGW